MAKVSQEEMLARVRAEMERVGAVLTGIAQVRAAREEAKKGGISEAAEFIALAALIKAEEGLVDLVVATEFGAYLSTLQTAWAEVMRPSVVGKGVSS